MITKAQKTAKQGLFNRDSIAVTLRAAGCFAGKKAMYGNGVLRSGFGIRRFQNTWEVYFIQDFDLNGLTDEQVFDRTYMLNIYESILHQHGYNIVRTQYCVSLSK
jgi:hypothetical protein